MVIQDFFPRIITWLFSSVSVHAVFFFHSYWKTQFVFKICQNLRSEYTWVVVEFLFLKQTFRVMLKPSSVIWKTKIAVIRYLKLKTWEIAYDNDPRPSHHRWRPKHQPKRLPQKQQQSEATNFNKTHDISLLHFFHF